MGEQAIPHDAPPSYEDTVKTPGGWCAPPPPTSQCPPTTGGESGTGTSHRPGVPPCQDGVPQLSDECHHKDHLLPQHAGLGVECDPLPDHALALLLYPPL